MTKSGPKRKRIFVDRQSTLVKKHNIEAGTIALKTSLSLTSNERRFTHRLIKHIGDQLDETFCEVMVMANEICVLIAPGSFGGKPIKSIIFNNLIDTNKVSGKRKKGAYKCAPGCDICTVTYIDDSKISLKTPVGGQLIEVNEALIANPELILDRHKGCGYIAIIFPNSKLPTL
jgi:hypothetical protein